MTDPAPKTWFITGAGRGLGRVFAEYALERGACVVATARTAEGLKDLPPHERLLGVVMDPADRAQVLAAVQRGAAHFGGLDVVVNNAGYGHFGPVETLADEELAAQLAANLYGPLHVCQAVLPVLRQRGGGRIFQLSSIAGVAGSVGGGAYAASKFALEGLSESLAQEVAGDNIFVTIIEPGGFRTDFASGASARYSKAGDHPGLQQVKARLASFSGKQPGIPTELARVLWELAALADPPMRLLVGRDALARATVKYDFNRKEMVEFERYTLTEEYPGSVGLGHSAYTRPWAKRG